MSNFITEASAELEHVVWPTPTENKKYMIYTIGVIVVIGIFLAVLGYVVTNGLSLTRDQFPHDPIIVPTVSSEDPSMNPELNKIIDNINEKTTPINTGSMNTGSGLGTTTASGSN